MLPGRHARRPHSRPLWGVHPEDVHFEARFGNDLHTAGLAGRGRRPRYSDSGGSGDLSGARRKPIAALPDQTREGREGAGASGTWWPARLRIGSGMRSWGSSGISPWRRPQTSSASRSSTSSGARSWVKPGSGRGAHPPLQSGRGTDRWSGLGADLEARISAQQDRLHQPHGPAVSYPDGWDLGLARGSWSPATSPGGRKLPPVFAALATLAQFSRCPHDGSRSPAADRSPGRRSLKPAGVTWLSWVATSIRECQPDRSPVKVGIPAIRCRSRSLRFKVGLLRSMRQPGPRQAPGRSRRRRRRCRPHGRADRRAAGLPAPAAPGRPHQAPGWAPAPARRSAPRRRCQPRHRRHRRRPMLRPAPPVSWPPAPPAAPRPGRSSAASCPDPAVTPAVPA
jgi:hypothetical protein